jgi:hypothetical protein
MIKGPSLKKTFAETRKVMDGPFGNYAIYEHCLPFNVSRAGSHPIAYAREPQPSSSMLEQPRCAIVLSISSRKMLIARTAPASPPTAIEHVAA